jgi:hypothetical protein
MKIEVAEPEPSPANAPNPESLERYGRDELPKYVDCGDKRLLTDECQRDRTEDPARYFGGVYGLGLIALATEAAHSSAPHRTTRKMLKEHGGITGLAAHISDTLFRHHGVEAHVHSAEWTEGHPTRIRRNLESDPDSVLMANFGEILTNFDWPAVRDKAHQIAQSSSDESFLGSVDVDRVASNTQAVLSAIGDESYKVGRNEVTTAIKDTRQQTPVAILQGQPDITDQTSVILDLVGYKIPADGKNYVHSIPLARSLLPRIFDWGNSYNHALDSGSLLLGLATQQKLGIQNLLLLSENADLTEI